jgi:hypothetical protein
LSTARDTHLLQEWTEERMRVDRSACTILGVDADVEIQRDAHETPSGEAERDNDTSEKENREQRTWAHSRRETSTSGTGMYGAG